MKILSVQYQFMPRLKWWLSGRTKQRKFSILKSLVESCEPSSSISQRTLTMEKDAAWRGVRKPSSNIISVKPRKVRLKENLCENRAYRSTQMMPRPIGQEVPRGLTSWGKAGMQHSSQQWSCWCAPRLCRTAYTSHTTRWPSSTRHSKP